ncbi:hypothetical protein [Pseudomonas amygdali]|jgi:hypothetical protein|uniref:hypothetical protein n=1 Tax=Pseudomonas amygdali TaxID=47877 RepID=UPI0006B95966|nr:hypothetical protein [Pseudomonas amygdali]AVX93047.1 hypothetical protein PkP19E3_33325 [Pseudomonas koreensis]KPB17027.1 Unknown protein sequence [Pseudomonas amygdali pv. sesami]
MERFKDRLSRLDKCAAAVANSKETDASKNEVAGQVAVYAAILLDLGATPRPNESEVLGPIDQFCVLVERTFPQAIGVAQ